MSLSLAPSDEGARQNTPRGTPRGVFRRRSLALGRALSRRLRVVPATGAKAASLGCLRPIAGQDQPHHDHHREPGHGFLHVQCRGILPDENEPETEWPFPARRSNAGPWSRSRRGRIGRCRYCRSECSDDRRRRRGRCHPHRHSARHRSRPAPRSSTDQSWSH